MADWKTVRFDPTYEEKLDPEIIPLCDALNAAGIITTSSCCGHGYMWPHVWFEHSTDERIESLARFVLREENRLHELPEWCKPDQATGELVSRFPYFSMWQKEILLPDSVVSRIYGNTGYHWCVEIHLNNVFRNTPCADGLKEAEYALASLTQMVNDWGDSSKQMMVCK
jgi:hypothetical protein